MSARGIRRLLDGDVALRGRRLFDDHVGFSIPHFFHVLVHFQVSPDQSRELMGCVIINLDQCLYGFRPGQGPANILRMAGPKFQHIGLYRA